MNDPHVEQLRYELDSPAEDIQFKDDIAPVNTEYDCFSMTLADGVLSVFPSEHFPSVESARSELEPFLCAWEAHNELSGEGLLRFRYLDAELIDRKPTPGVVSGIAGAVMGGMIVGATAVMLRGAYPSPPPSWFKEHPRGKVLRMRLRSVLSGEEPLLTGAYAILSKLEKSYGGRRQAASHLQVEFAVLHRLGGLCGVEVPNQWRKAGGPQRKLTGQEEAWAKEALRTLVFRVFEIDSGAPIVSRLTMSQLPDIT